MNAKELVQKYFDCFFSSAPNLNEIRTLLNDDFTFSGPLIQASSADEYIDKLKSMGIIDLKANILSILSSDDQVAVMYKLVTPFGEFPTVEWFEIKSDKINSIRLLNDPRPFLDNFA